MSITEQMTRIPAVAATPETRRLATANADTHWMTRSNTALIKIILIGATAPRH